MSLMSSLKSSRALSVPSPQFHWIHFKMETWSMRKCETWPFFAYGEITMSGTRWPRPWESICGGGTWSHHPPLSSHVMTMAVSAQELEFCTRRMNPSSQFAAVVMEPEPGCMLCPGVGWMYDTDGSDPPSSAL